MDGFFAKTLPLAQYHFSLWLTRWLCRSHFFHRMLTKSAVPPGRLMSVGALMDLDRYSRLSYR